jgi:hypothetical protein
MVNLRPCATSSMCRMDKAVRWGFWAFAGIGAFYLYTEHRAHLLDYLPYLLLIACPLVHMFGHGHGGHGRERQDDTSGNRAQRS